MLSANFPIYDLAFILVNSPYYGGSGGEFSSASTDPSSSEVSIHEIGHSFASLADEYWAGDIYAYDHPNLTMESNPLKIRWKKWLGFNDIGIYAHDESPTWYRPHQNCKMRFLGVPFCSVCRESFTEQFHTSVKPLLSYLPTSSVVILNSGSVNFSVNLLKPVPNTFKVTWKKNGEIMNGSKNKDLITMQASSLTEEDSIVEAQVIDTTSLTRSETHLTSHVYTVTWQIKRDNITGLEINAVEAQYDISVFPNPVSDWLNISYSLPKTSMVNISVKDVTGKSIKTLVNEKQLAGKHDYKIKDSELNMSKSGVYFLNLNINGIEIAEKLVRE